MNFPEEPKKEGDGEGGGGLVGEKEGAGGAAKFENRSSKCEEFVLD
jgi:hypothetical protein